GEEEDKKLKSAIKEATGPIQTELEKTKEQVATLSKPAPEGTGPPMSKLEEYIEFRKKLKDSGLIKDERSNIMLGPDGQPIPISGEIPAALVYGPYIAKQILDTVEETVINIGNKYGLTGEEPTKAPRKPKEPFIKMPPKPKTIEPVTEAGIETTAAEAEGLSGEMFIFSARVAQRLVSTEGLTPEMKPQVQKVQDSYRKELLEVLQGKRGLADWVQKVQTTLGKHRQTILQILLESATGLKDEELIELQKFCGKALETGVM
ncbi:unnamed protein product, partial [marine sediment metagenome]